MTYRVLAEPDPDGGYRIAAIRVYDTGARQVHRWGATVAYHTTDQTLAGDDVWLRLDDQALTDVQEMREILALYPSNLQAVVDGEEPPRWDPLP